MRHKLVASYGDMIIFKKYDDIWVVDSSYYDEENKIVINKLQDGEKSDTVVSYQNKGLPLINTQSSAIKIDDINDIEIIPLYEAIKTQKIFYNQYPSLNDRVVCFYTVRIGDKIKDAIKISKLTGQTVILQYCSNNDQRMYIPVVKEDWYFDVMVRWLLYVKQLIY